MSKNISPGKSTIDEVKEIMPNADFQTETSKAVVDIFNADHENIYYLVNKVAKARSRKMQYFKELITVILAHQEAEEMVFFNNSSIKSNVQRAKREIMAEHETVRRQIQCVMDTYEDDDMWDSRYNVLKKLIVKHLESEVNIIEESIFEDTENLDLDLIEKDYVKSMKELMNKISANLGTGVVLREMDMIPHGSVLMTKHK